MNNWNIQELLEKKMRYLNPKDELSPMTVIFSDYIFYRGLEIQMLTLTLYFSNKY